MTNKPSFLNLAPNFDRFVEIISVFRAYGLGDWLDNTKLSWLKSVLSKKKLNPEIATYSLEKRMRLAIVELGPTFIKLGQILSTRDDLISQELVNELKELQANVPSDSFEYIQQVLFEEFHIDALKEVFSTFSETPLASASIGQVHSAMLVSGESVVVKVMHQGIEETLEKDFKILKYLARIAEKYSHQLAQYKPIETMNSFEQSILSELDFRQEKNHLNKFKDNFKEDGFIVFPQAYSNFCTQRVLTMEFLKGTKIDSLSELSITQAEKKQIAQAGAQMYMDMIFRDNFYHADPHPGNLLYLGENKIGVLDCGMAGKLDEKTRKNLEKVIEGVAQKDHEAVTESFLELGTIPEKCDREKLKSEMTEFIASNISMPLDEINMTELGTNGMAIIQKHGVILPSNLTLLMRALVMLEGTSRSLAPDFNLVKIFEDYYKKMMIQQFTPKSILARVGKNFRRWERIIELTPKVMDKALTKADHGDFRIKLEHKNLKEPVQFLVTGIFIASLLLCSTLLISFKVGPSIGEYSIIGSIGLIISIFMAIRLFLKFSKD